MAGRDHEDLRLAVYRAFARDGRAPDVPSLAADLEDEPAAVASGLRALAAARHVVLDERDRILMAHPFSAVPLGFAVMGRGTLWWGGCAWDSFAIPHLLPGEPDVLVATRCPACDRPLAWVVQRGAPPGGAAVAHFLVPVARMWDDVLLTCGNQRLFCDEGCVEAWLSRTGRGRGDVLDLATLWRLAQWLVRRAAGPRLRASGPGGGRSLLPIGRALRAVLGTLIDGSGGSTWPRPGPASRAAACPSRRVGRVVSVAGRSRAAVRPSRRPRVAQRGQPGPSTVRNRSVAATSRSTVPGSVAACPASATTSNVASGQRRWRSQAVVIGQHRS